MAIPTSPLRSHADLADLLNLPLSTTIELRKREQWPHMRFGRKVRFTDEQVDQILAQHASVDAAKAPPIFAGQTPRSARRRAS